MSGNFDHNDIAEDLAALRERVATLEQAAQPIELPTISPEAFLEAVYGAAGRQVVAEAKGIDSLDTTTI